MPGCPGCLKPGTNTFCTRCRQRLFDGRKVSPVLPFSRPVYNQARLALPTQRLSISGIQNKMSIVLRGDQLELTESGGQYILKPVPHGEFQHLNQMPANEHLSMQIARQVFRIPVAENALVRFSDGEPAYLVRRFDVIPNRPRALQEDFAQLASRSGETHGINYKYDGSYEEIGRLIRQHVGAARVELERFFRLVVFNYLVHNGDAHLKNFSLIKFDNQGNYTLTPAYDLLNSRLHLPTESRTALDLFRDEFETPSFAAYAFYAYDDFHEFANRLNLRPARFSHFMQTVQTAEVAVMARIARSSLTDECKELYRVHVRDSIKALSYSYGKYI